MIISKTPFRISFFGGGTDYAPFVEKWGGAVLSTAINKFTYISCRYLPPFFLHKYRIVYSKVENVQFIEEIEHPAIKAVLLESRIHQGLEIHCDADLPARSGLGSSSSFVIGLINALNALEGRRISKFELAEEAIRIEQNVLKENVGSQDQVAAAYGGFNCIHFEKNGEIVVEPMILSINRKESLNKHLMLFFTGISRFSSEVAQSQVNNLDARIVELNRMKRMVEEGVNLLSGDFDIRDFGLLLHEAWQYKKSLSKDISNSYIDELYEKARSSGAIGGKILGAGGGGFLLLFVEPKNQENVKDALSHLIHVPFEFETKGSEIIYYQPTYSAKRDQEAHAL